MTRKKALEVKKTDKFLPQSKNEQAALIEDKFELFSLNSIQFHQQFMLDDQKVSMWIFMFWQLVGGLMSVYYDPEMTAVKQFYISSLVIAFNALSRYIWTFRISHDPTVYVSLNLRQDYKQFFNNLTYQEAKVHLQQLRESTKSDQFHQRMAFVGRRYMALSVYSNVLVTALESWGSPFDFFGVWSRWGKNFATQFLGYTATNLVLLRLRYQMNISKNQQQATLIQLRELLDYIFTDFDLTMPQEDKFSQSGFLQSDYFLYMKHLSRITLSFSKHKTRIKNYRQTIPSWDYLITILARRLNQEFSNIILGTSENFLEIVILPKKIKLPELAILQKELYDLMHSNAQSLVGADAHCRALNQQTQALSSSSWKYVCNITAHDQIQVTLSYGISTLNDTEIDALIQGLLKEQYQVEQKGTTLSVKFDKEVGALDHLKQFLSELKLPQKDTTRCVVKNTPAVNFTPADFI